MPVIPPLVAAIMNYLGLALTAGAVLDAAMGAFDAHRGDAAKVAAAAAKAAGIKLGAAEKRAAAREGLKAAREAATAAADKKRIMPKLGKAAGVGITGLFALSMLPMLKEMFGGGGGEGGMPQQMGGGGEQDLMALLGNLEQQAGASFADTKEAYSRSRGERKIQDIMSGMSSRQTGFGIRSDLDEIIRGNEEEIARISSVQPVTMAEALARRGIFAAPDNGSLNLQGMM